LQTHRGVIDVDLEPDEAAEENVAHEETPSFQITPPAPVDYLVDSQYEVSSEDEPSEDEASEDEPSEDEASEDESSEDEQSSYEPVSENDPATEPYADEM